MEMRPLEQTDVPRVAIWNVELHEDEASSPMGIADAEVRLHSWLSNSKFQGMIFAVEGIEVGYILFEVQDATSDLRGSSESIYVRQFYIARESRRRGYGKKAFRQFLSEVGDKRMTLDVKATNPAGRKFWESIGFIPQHIAYQLD